MWVNPDYTPLGSVWFTKFPPNYHILKFVIYTNLTYDFFIHDPKYFVLNVNPVGVPSIRRKFNPKSLSSHYYRLAVAEVEELDLPNDPCTSALWRSRRP